MAIEFEKLWDGTLTVSEEDAIAICHGCNRELPRIGWEGKVQHEGKWYWLSRTYNNGVRVWMLRECEVLPNGQIW